MWNSQPTNDDTDPQAEEYPLCPADAMAMIANALQGLQVWAKRNQAIDIQIAMRDRDPESLALRIILAVMKRR